MKLLRRFWNQSRRWLVLTPILRDSRIGWALVIFAMLQVGVSLAGYRLWRCPFEEMTGWRCPGCGLTTGCKALLAGHFAEAVKFNWLAPLVVFGFLVIAIGLAIPRKQRQKVVAIVGSVESFVRSGLLLVALVIVQIVFRLIGKA